MTPDDKPHLSVLMPTYNYADFIGDSVESILAQEIAGVEIVVVDDGSTDGTDRALDPWIERRQVRYIRQENSGPSSARNRAMAEARADLLMFLDADDSLLPGCIARTLDFLSRNPDVGLFFTNYDIFDESGVLSPSGVDTWKVFRTIPHEEVAPGEWLFTSSLTPYIIRHGGFMSTSGLTVRRELVDRVGGFREGYSYGEDDDFYARVTQVTRAGYVDEVLSRKRSHPESVTQDPRRQLRNVRHLLELTELQLEYYSEPELQEILHGKARSSAFAYCWGLIHRGRAAEARALLRTYLDRYPAYWPFYRLFLKSLLPRALVPLLRSRRRTG